MRGVKPHLVVDNEVGAIQAEPEPPDWFSVSAADEWRRVIPHLVAKRRLNDGDLGSLESYCLAMGQVRDMQKLIATEGAVINDPKRGPRKHPAVAIQADASTRARLLANELGLTPVSRSRPSIRDDDRDNSGQPELFGVDF